MVSDLRHHTWAERVWSCSALFAGGMTCLQLAAAHSVALAQSWPTKQPIKLISPFAPGAAPEAAGRPVFERVSKALGQSFVWENRAGAGGTIGAAAVAKAEPDGYTLLVNSSAHTVAPAIFANLRYDVVKDLVAVAPLGDLPTVLIVPLARYKTLAEMVAAGAAKPGSLTYGSAGVGSGSHLKAEKLLLAAGIKAAHVPFKGGPDMVREIVGNRIDFAFANLSNALQLIESNEMRALAIGGVKRTLTRPELQTLGEAGYPKAESLFWVGVFAPAGTSGEIVQRLHQLITAVVSEPSMKETLGKIGVEPMPQSSAEFDALVRTEVESNLELVKAAGIKVN